MLWILERLNGNDSEDFVSPLYMLFRVKLHPAMSVSTPESELSFFTKSLRYVGGTCTAWTT